MLKQWWMGLGLAALGVGMGCGESHGDVVCGHGTELDRGHCVAETEIQCGEGTRLLDGACVPVSKINCGAGTLLAGSECVPDGSGSTLTCGEGTVLEADRCVAEGSVTCGEGTVLDREECVPADDAVVCGDGTKLSGGECVPEDSVTCGEGTKLDGDECVPSGTISCGAGTELSGDECVPNGELHCGAGTEQSGDECVPISVTCGLGTRIEGDECVVASSSSSPTSSTFPFKLADKGSTSIVYFLDSGGVAVHRYDLATHEFLMPYSLSESATTLSVTDAGDAVYVGSSTGRINWIDTETGDSSFLVAAPETLLWIAAVDAFVYTIDASGAWETHALYRRSDGERTFADDWRNQSNGSAYAKTSHRIFTFRDGTSPNDIYYEVLDPATGTLGIDTESPYHGDYTMTHPIRVSPDETRVYVASGAAFNTSDLTYAASIGFSYVDLAFHGDRLYLLRANGTDSSDVIELDAGYAIVGSVTITGTPLRLFVHDHELTVFTRGSGSAISTWRQTL